MDLLFLFQKAFSVPPKLPGWDLAGDIDMEAGFW